MSLMTGRQREALCEALCTAFDQESLAQMLRFRLDKDLTHIAGAGGLRAIVFSVIEVAVREGWQADLILAATSHNPENRALRTFCEENPALTSPHVLSAPDSKSADAIRGEDAETPRPTPIDLRRVAPWVGCLMFAPFVFFLVASLTVVIGGYYFIVKPSMEEHEKTRQRHQEEHEAFEKKHFGPNR